MVRVHTRCQMKLLQEKLPLTGLLSTKGDWYGQDMSLYRGGFNKRYMLGLQGDPQLSHDVFLLINYQLTEPFTMR